MTALPHDPDAALPQRLQLLAERFGEQLPRTGTVAVAFSGGVDSSVTVALSVRALGASRVLAVLGVSPSLSALERRQARATAQSLGVRFEEVRTFELDDPRYVANRGDRCYFCKYELYTRVFTDGVSELGITQLINGDTWDDHQAGDRPGRRAAQELSVVSPLALAGIDKAAVRELARELGLAVWDKPSAPCLASRVPVNTPVTRERLADVEHAEAELHSLGLRHFRVRHLGSTARVELGAEEQDLCESAEIEAGVRRAVQVAGFTEVTIASEPLRRS